MLDFLHCVKAATFQLKYNLEEEGEITVSQRGSNTVAGKDCVGPNFP